MRERTVSGATREYLVLEYASRPSAGQPADRLFVPTDALDEVSRYVGGEVPDAEQARRRRLGQDQGPRAQGRPADRRPARAALRRPPVRARARVRARTRRGSASWRTRSRSPRRPTSSSAIDEVKADMERPVPMDRVISGDVGFGKTEIAVRAAFKAVQDGKQVAVLVPTTLLATQHLQHLHRADARVPGDRQGAVAVHRRRGGPGDDRGPGRRHGGRRDRHPPAAADRGALEGPRAGDRRRGAALRRRAQGAHHRAAHARRRAHAVARPRSRARWR